MSAAPPELLARVNSALRRRADTKGSGSELSISCLEPTHTDAHPSATWNTDKGAGCCHSGNCGASWNTLQAAELLGINFPRNGSRPEELVTRYQVRNPDGSPWIATKFRSDRGSKEKTFWWEPKLKDLGVKVSDAPVWRAEHVDAMDPAKVLFVAEGEKAAERGAGVGLQFVGTMTGSGSTPSRERLAFAAKWRGGAPVVLMCDNDDAGRRHMRRVAANLPPGLDARLWCPKELPEKGDVEEWIELHGDQAATKALAVVAALPPIHSLDGSPGTAVDEADDHLERLISSEMERERARREARRRLDAEDRGAILKPEEYNLAEWLATPQEALAFRIEGWFTVRSRNFLVAACKSGKSTLIGNLIRSLVDGDPFLGEYFSHLIPGRLALWDTEMGEPLLRSWLGDQGIRNAHRVIVRPFRGRVASLNLLDKDVRAEWAAWLREQEISFLILDCLRPVLDALGLDEKTEAGRFLVPFDALLEEAGVAEALIADHMGHQGGKGDRSRERARGDSRKRDWQDSEWLLVREDPEDPASPRYISGYGRDIDQPEQRLDYDPATRRLTVGGGSRRDSKLEAPLALVVALLREQSGVTRRTIEADLEGGEYGRDIIRAAIKAGVQQGLILETPGPRRSILHSLSENECASARECAENQSRSSARVRGGLYISRALSALPEGGGEESSARTEKPGKVAV